MDAAVEPRPRRRPRHRLRGGASTTGERYVLAEARLGAVRARARRGRAGRHRAPAPSSSAAATRRCSPSSPTSPNAFQVLGADFVSTEDGTGVVHMSPGSRRGRPDRLQRRRHRHRRADGRARAATPPRSRRGPGIHVFDANPLGHPRAQGRGRVVRHETYDHRYPHCWRCATAARLPRHLVVVRAGHRSSATAWSS